MGKTQLAPGFRFHPTDVELVRYYLKRKVLGKKLLVDAIAEVDIYKFEPPDLPDMSYIKGGDLKWHFFCPKEKKYATGVRANRATECGYWKTTGKERVVLCNAEVVGMIKTLVYHFGKSPRGERTDWVMHEYRLEDKVLTQMNVRQDTYVVCVVFKKDGPGPRNGAQYGAPFREEDWTDEEEHTDILAVNNPTNTDVLAVNNPTNTDVLAVDSSTNFHGSNKETNLVVAALHDPNKDCIGGMISESCISDVLPATTTTTSELPHRIDAANTPLSGAPLLDSSSTAFLPETLQTTRNNDDDIYSMLDLFVADDEWLPFSGLNNNEVRHDPGVSALVCLEQGMFNELPDLSNLHNNNIPRIPSYDLLENSYLELQDLTAPVNPQIGNLSDSRRSYLNHQDHLQHVTAPLTPQSGNHLIDSRSSYLNHQSHLQDVTAPLAPPQSGNLNESRSSYLNHQGHFGFSGANDDDPYGFSASMGRGPDM